MIDRLEDRVEIAELRARYCQYYDHGRVDDFVALFAPGASLELGPMGIQEGTDAIRAAVMEAQKVSSGPGHFIRHFNPPGTTDFVDDDHATGASHLLFQLGGDTDLTGAGTYYDEYVKLDGQWRFAARRMTFLYFGEQPGGWPAMPAM
jgi:hypothetical protein